MNLDTERLKTKIQLELNRIEQERIKLEKDIGRLQAEKDRLNGTFDAVETVERIAKEIELIRNVGTTAGEPPLSPQEAKEPVIGYDHDSFGS